MTTTHDPTRSRSRPFRRRGNRTNTQTQTGWITILLDRSQALCKSELLKNVSIVLFLNKCDELEHKLALGLRVEDFVQLSSSKREKREVGTDVETVKTYFRRLFYGVFTKYGASNPTRNCYVHFTNITDLKSTRMLIGKVMDLIIKKNMEGVSAI